MKSIKYILAAFAMFTASTLFAQTIEDKGITYRILSASDKTAAVVKCTDEIEGDVVIPANVGEGYVVTTIADSAFLKCSGITTITIGSNVKEVGRHIVDHCFAMTDFKVDDNNRNFSTWKGILSNKDQSTLICCPPGKVGTLTIPETILSLAPAAFSTCKKLAEISISDNVKVIPEETFKGCWGLKQVHFPTQLEKIAYQAFANTILQKLFLPKSLRVIEDEAFAHNSITEVNVFDPQNPPTLGKDVFGVETKVMRLYVPNNAAIQVYRRAPRWNEFNVIMVQYDAAKYTKRFEAKEIGTEQGK
ncbi:MAG: leucine-rich repeat domain-containing protein [Bacteroidaceae bacterium]|nr:leucine-rich repeat domain-containing protein [Bacteroidaceae bacterium]